MARRYQLRVCRSQWARKAVKHLCWHSVQGQWPAASTVASSRKKSEVYIVWRHGRPRTALEVAHAEI